MVKKIVPFLIFTIVLAMPPLALTLTCNNSWIIPRFWLLFAFVGGLTLAAVIGVLMAQKRDPETYTQVFMGATVFKLLACLVFVLIYVMFNKVDKPIFMLNFMYLYFLNTGFEIYILLRNLRNQNLR
ncbi:hypothetical protein [Mucilaginibacter antarcticus]|uniref:ATP synthase protein I n=1 Tax=Mucilaginibacter antarcticus TaxID=1855725 RepID=A0ABW5XQK2_9SPHI